MAGCAIVSLVSYCAKYFELRMSFGSALACPNFILAKGPILFKNGKVLDIDNKQYKKQMRLGLPNVAKMCGNYKVRGRCAVAIVSVTLQDVGLIHRGDTSMVIDKNKLAGEKSECDYKPRHSSKN